MLLLVRKNCHFGVFKLNSKLAAKQMRAGTWKRKGPVGLDKLRTNISPPNTRNGGVWWSNLLTGYKVITVNNFF
jgi:hypothetical protein